jgi:YesN/AraC family two-component response regulator
MRLARTHGNAIQLLFTDVVMPEMSGLDLSKELAADYPSIRSLFASGYTSSMIAHHGVLDGGVPFIQKPYSLRELALKLREVLD